MRKPLIPRPLLINITGRLQKVSPIGKYSILITVTLSAVAFALSLEPIPQSQTYHRFADKRNFLGLPNCFNVVTNLPFYILGIIGIIKLQKSHAEGIHFTNYLVLFIGILLTGFGSAFYHFHPDDATLVFDRIPLVIVFMAFLSITIAECIAEQIARTLLPPLLLFGIFSVLWWYYTEIKSAGDLRMYGFAQFYTIYVIPIIAFLFPSTIFRKGINSLLWINVTYAIAKFSEHFDKEIYSFTHFISGHSLKHIAASLSCWFIIEMFEKKFSK